MIDQEIFELGTFIRGYFRKNKVEYTLTGLDVFEALSRSDRWGCRFKDKFAFYAFLNRLVADNKLCLLRCCSLEYGGNRGDQKQWIFYSKAKAGMDNPDLQDRDGTREDLYSAEKNKKASDGTLLRSYQEVYIYNSLRKVEGLSVWYEEPLKLTSGRTLLPDFTLLSKHCGSRKIYWEHFGYFGTSYKSRTEDKLLMYRESGIHNIEKGGNLIRSYYRNEVQFKQEILDHIISVKNYLDLA